MSIIQAANLTFAYEGSYDNIFENVSFTLDTDWRLGFTGRNGRGKTTFLRLLTGELDDHGSISKSVECSYFPYPTSDASGMALDVLQALCPAAQEWELMRELNLLEFNCEALYRPFDTLSGGERVKAQLAALFLNEGRFLLIDEPTNHLDTQGRRALGAYLRQKRGFLLVSHDRALLDTCTDHTLAINKASIEVIAGNFSSWWEQKQRQDQFEQAENEKLKRDIKQLEAAARQSAQWADKVESTKRGKGADAARKKGHVGMDTMAYNAEKSRRLQQRRKNLEHRQSSAIDEKSQLLKNIEQADDLKIHPLQFHSEKLLEFDHVTLAYGKNTVCENVSFTLRRGERLAVTGHNGSGKSSVLKAVLGEAGLAVTGGLHLPAQLKISCVPQDTSFLRGRLDDYAEACGIDESLFKAILRKLDFSRAQFEKDMADFSSGQKKKALLARSLCEQAHVYIWDEPLNFIDVFSRMQIERLLREYQPAMLFVEHDEAFCGAVATGRVEM